MAPLPDNNTGVLFIEYTAGGQAHTAQVRMAALATSTEAAAAYGVLAPAMRPYLQAADSITGARWRGPNLTVSLPLAVSAYAGTGAGTADPDKKPNFQSWTGRSADGRDVKFTIFSNLIDVVLNGYRKPTMDATDTGVLNALKHASVDARSISGMPVFWNSYVNLGVNAYYQRKARRTTG